MKKSTTYLTTFCIVIAGAAMAVAQTTTLPVNPPPAVAPPASAPAMPPMPSMINPSSNIQPLTPVPLNPTPPTRQSMRQTVQTPDPMGPGGPRAGALPQTPFDQVMAVAVCGETKTPSDDCVKHGEEEATEKLSDFYAAQYAKKEMNSSLTVSFPKTMSRSEQLRAIARIEKAALAAAITKMEVDIARQTEDRPDKQTVADPNTRKLKQWAEKANSEAEKGSNWTHDWSSNTHKFTEGDAYRQLKNITKSG
ncbi:MAG: hypothetical protein ACJ8NS_00775 [Chthoniobacterales bacterium]